MAMRIDSVSSFLSMSFTLLEPISDRCMCESKKDCQNSQPFDRIVIGNNGYKEKYENDECVFNVMCFAFKYVCQFFNNNNSNWLSGFRIVWFLHIRIVYYHLALCARGSPEPRLHSRQQTQL